MQTVIVIPARFASSRYPGKPLAMLRDAQGVSKSLIERSWQAAMAVGGVSAVYVATDDDRIAEHAAGFGAEVLMTSPHCRNGTERCADALAALDQTPDLVVNLQGDAPLTPAWFVEDLITAMQNAPGDIAMATPVLRCDAATLVAFLEDRKAGRIGGTTAVFDCDHQALYFSKEVLPYIHPDKVATLDPVPVFHHVGCYAYRPAMLGQYITWREGPLEALEGLEQLRFLENGQKILCVEVEARGKVFWELNNPEDIPRIEAALAQIG